MDGSSATTRSARFEHTESVKIAMNYRNRNDVNDIITRKFLLSESHKVSDAPVNAEQIPFRVFY